MGWPEDFITEVTGAQPKKRGRPRKDPTAPRLSTKIPLLAPAHQAIVNSFFVNGCVSRRRACTVNGFAASYARDVFAREDVKAEVERRRARLVERTAVTEARVIEEMAKLAFANAGDLLEVNEDGTAYLDLNNMTDAHRAAMSEFNVETYEEKSAGAYDTVPDGNDDETLPQLYVPVKKSRIKFASKQAALDSLARILGMFKDKVEVSGVASLTDRIAAARKRIHEEATKETPCP